MSASILDVSPIPGVKDLFTLLAFLNDPKAVEKRLRDLTTQEAQLRARVEEVGKAGEVETLWAQARALKTEATELKALAITDANVLKAAALEERDRAVAETAKLRQDVATERTALERAIGDASRSAQERAAHLAARSAEVDRQVTAAAQTLREGQALKAEFEGRLAKLKAATEAAGV